MSNKPEVIVAPAPSAKRGALGSSSVAEGMRVALKAAGMTDAMIEATIKNALTSAHQIHQTTPTVRRAKAALLTPESFAGNQRPWHGIGNIIEKGDTIPQIMVKAGLDWEPAICKAGFEFNDQWYESPDGRKVVRLKINADGSQELIVLAENVSPNYTVIKNRDSVDFMYHVAEGLGDFQTLGMFGDGQVVFGCMKLPTVQLLRDQTLDPYIVFRTSHDGSVEFEGWRSSIRPECGNMLNASRQSATKKRGMISIRHSKGAIVAIEEARKELKILAGGIREEMHYQNALLECGFTKADFEKYLKDIFPSEKDATLVENRRAAVLSLLEIEDHAKFAGTAYAALQAVTRYADHGGLRVNEIEGETDDRKARRLAESKMFGKGAAFKTAAWDRLLQVCKVPVYDAPKAEQALIAAGRTLHPDAQPTQALPAPGDAQTA